jgi:hypothetical protein
MTMDEATLRQLNGSIDKWQRIVDGVERDRGAGNCPLCDMFNTSLGGGCGVCPVNIASGDRMCGNTPWTDWREHQYGHKGAPYWNVKCNECLRLAENELEFLKSLLPQPQFNIGDEVIGRFSHDYYRIVSVENVDGKFKYCFLDGNWAFEEDILLRKENEDFQVGDIVECIDAEDGSAKSLDLQKGGLYEITYITTMWDTVFVKLQSPYDGTLSYATRFKLFKRCGK